MLAREEMVGGSVQRVMRGRHSYTLLYLFQRGGRVTAPGYILLITVNYKLPNTLTCLKNKWCHKYFVHTLRTTSSFLQNYLLVL
jgi:hypothetical protein